MTRGEAVNWLINITADIGKSEHRDLWHYEQALSEIREMLESEPERKTGKWEEREVLSEKVIDEWQSARCLVCGKYHTTPYMYFFQVYNYCPTCGARMRGGDDDTR